MKSQIRENCEQVQRNVSSAESGDKFASFLTLCNLLARPGCVLAKVLLSGEEFTVQSRKVMNFRRGASLSALSTPSGIIYPLKFSYAPCPNAGSYEVRRWKLSIIAAMCIQFLLPTMKLQYDNCYSVGDLEFTCLFPLSLRSSASTAPPRCPFSSAISKTSFSRKMKPFDSAFSYIFQIYYARAIPKKRVRKSPASSPRNRYLINFQDDVVNFNPLVDFQFQFNARSACVFSLCGISKWK